MLKMLRRSLVSTPLPTPHQTMIGKMYVQFQIATKRRTWPRRLRLQRVGARRDTRWKERLVPAMRRKAIWPRSWPITELHVDLAILKVCTR